MIRTSYRTVDRFYQSRSFKTLAGARRYAHRVMGEHPDVSETFGYAVSFDGTAKLSVRGVLLADLFPPVAAPWSSDEVLAALAPGCPPCEDGGPIAVDVEDADDDIPF